MRTLNTFFIMADEDPITQVEGEPAPASPLTEYSVVYTDRALNL